MTGITLKSPGQFPPGTTGISAYPVGNWPAHVLQPSGAPVGAAAAGPVTAGSDGSVAFPALADGKYWAAADLGGGNYRYVKFTVGQDSRPSVAGVQAEVDAEEAARAAADTVIAANTQTNDYTLVLADAGKCVEVNNAAAKVVTVPPNSAVAFPVGTVIEVHRYGAGAAALAAGAGVTIRAPGGTLTLRAQYSTAALRKRATDEWVLSGDLG